MSRRKTHKYALAEQLDNVIQMPKEFHSNCRGRWAKDYFQNEQAIVLELGCGRGEYSNGLAQRFPEKNFIGIDVKGDRLAAAGRNAKNLDLKNTAFLRIQIQFILDFFEPNEVDEIWITFPDPRPKNRDEKKRLSNAFFMGLYQEILKPQGLIHLKTDADSLYQYSLETWQSLPNWKIQAQTEDLYQSPWNEIHYGIKTRFEGIFHAQGNSIKYLQASNKKGNL